MPLTPFQQAVARLLSAQRTPGGFPRVPLEARELVCHFGRPGGVLPQVG